MITALVHERISIIHPPIPVFALPAEREGLTAQLVAAGRASEQLRRQLNLAMPVFLFIFTACYRQMQHLV